jgi:hypothetical protein
MAKAKLAGLITDNQKVSIETVTNDMELARWITARLDDANKHEAGGAEHGSSPVEPPPEAQRH